MNDMRKAIEPKSDQMNADSLIAGPMTITITDVSIRGGQEQPVSIHFEGDDGKPWKPCKSMSRVLVAAWGPDAKQYVGRSVTLYRDPKVKWAGMEVGGIRISHMSHIEREMLMQLTATRGKRAPHLVKPLELPKVDNAKERAQAWADGLIQQIATSDDVDALMAKEGKGLARLQQSYPDIADQISAAVLARGEGVNNA